MNAPHSAENDAHAYQPFGDAFAEETGVDPRECAECGTNHEAVTPPGSGQQS